MRHAGQIVLEVTVWCLREQSDDLKSVKPARKYNVLCTYGGRIQHISITES